MPKPTIMNEKIQEIAQRLRGLRDLLEVPTSEMATACNVSDEEYQGYESGKKDIPIGALQNISKKYNIELMALLFGEEPTMKTYYLTRAGQGTAMERTKAYKYHSLAAGFVGRKAEPFIVTIEPEAENTPLHLNSHNGQEFNYVLDGSMLLKIDDHELTLNQGDSIYFDATHPHAMKALNGKTVKFLALIL
jgi:mannose-6-phosphate isomerase-like protein (cupin superfamily)